MITTLLIIVVLLLLMVVLLIMSSNALADIVKKKNKEIAKLERLRGNDACEIDFMEWHVEMLKHSKEHAVEEYQKLANKRMYCVVRGRLGEINISIGYMVGYRYEVLPLGFIIDFKSGKMIDKMEGKEISIYE